MCVNVHYIFIINMSKMVRLNGFAERPAAKVNRRTYNTLINPNDVKYDE